MITRRGVIGVALAGVATSPAFAAARLSEDGLYQMEWYLESFLDLSDDLSAATAEGKRFAILWGLRNCPACRVMHQVYLADPAVETFIRTHFSILHLNILGARQVTDFDGSQLTEKALAARYGIEGTPAVQFFPTTVAALADKPPRSREVDRMASLPDRKQFLATFEKVQQGSSQPLAR